MSLQKSLHELEASIADLSLEEELQVLGNYFQGKITFSTSLGQEDQVITHLIASLKLPVSIFSLDTGRLFPETLDLLARTQAKYKLPIKVYYPETQQVEDLVLQQGINGFYEGVEQRKNCCFVRKVVPLQRALTGNQVWITGLRAEQSPNRASMKRLEWDEANQIIKYNPLLEWTYEQLLQYIQTHTIPYNPLHDKNFISIGCAPCTRAIQPGEDARAGRWWWEESKKECGLHGGEKG
ncbi:phosphoadenylyl-sulfate reductase [Mongoliitalea daihaiensis]|uniref:phosphoadenylyl-sulfate reductase n=1 Tax=Mongoliitalea daihaiensis TaxID=2782006 RepID=UPI001F22FDEA|nr:phosphoadenylyl-sulfate reductase [Mongoliitalea daihaiensis]UJP66901.1 phosphoadenylyl-sulfate reductase [Mongoliitalea daihaiensis]